jgi:hypothetical protein
MWCGTRWLSPQDQYSYESSKGINKRLPPTLVPVPVRVVPLPVREHNRATQGQVVLPPVHLLDEAPRRSEELMETPGPGAGQGPGIVVAISFWAAAGRPSDAWSGRSTLVRKHAIHSRTNISIIFIISALP